MTTVAIMPPPPASTCSIISRTPLVFVAILILTSMLSTFSATARAQNVTTVEIGSGTLDHDRIDGPRWTRVNFDPLISGTQTLRVAWDSNANIRFSIFQILDSPPPDRIRIATTSGTATPGEWTGTLDSAEQYFLGIWSASGSANFTASIEAEVVEPIALEVLTQPTDLTVIEGDEATFTVTATGSGTLVYQWLANEETISGATDSTLLISTTTLDDSGTAYSVEITDDNGSITSSSALLTVDEAPVPLSIASQPADLTVTEGEDATFAVTATGSGTLMYQWLANEETISGATDSTLLISTTVLDDSGTAYSVEITDDNGSITSSSALLTVDEAPVPLSIASQPADLTVTEGEDATFAVTATGSGALAYQWLANDIVIVDAIDSILSVSTTTLDDNGTSYSVEITDDNGSIISDSAVLTVDEAPIFLNITTPPADLTILEGEDATFTVIAEGAGTLSYQWLANGDNIVDATDSILVISAATLADSGTTYQVQITDDDSVGYASATLTVEAIPLEIVTQPTDLSVVEGEDATFTVTATGSGTLGYQWHTDGVAIADAIDSTLTVSGTTLENSGTVFSVDITDDNGSITSEDAVLSVDEAPIPLSITTQPADLSVNEGEDATFTVVATGSGTLEYQWFNNGDVIPDATSDTLLLNATSLADDGNIYRVDITDDNGFISSDEVTLGVIEIVLPVTMVNIGEGTLDSEKNAGPRWVRLDFDSLAAATHTITVSWDSDADVRFNVREANGTLISAVIEGANPGVWTGELEADEQYYLGLWSASGIANYTVTIEANVPITVNSQPSGLIVTEGDNASFEVEATGSGTLTYQWFADDYPITGETADSLTVFATSLADNGIGYSVEVSNGVDTATSDVAILTVNEPLILGLFSQEADTSTWMLDGPAPTLDYKAGANTDAWGRDLLRIGDILLVGGDFQGIKPTRNGTVTAQPFLAALDAVTGQPVSTFQVPSEVDSVVRSLVLSPDASQVFVGGDFGLLALDAITGELNFAVSVTDGNNDGRVFDIEVTNTQIYIGGDFNKVHNTFRANIARLSLDGELDATWTPQVTNGFSAGRSAPVQSLAVSKSEDTVYVGGNFRFIDGTPVPMTPQNNRISMLSLSAIDGTVLPERFSPNVGDNNKGVTAHDIAVTDFYVIVAWGGPNFLSFHSLDGNRLRQYKGKGDVQALQVVGDHVFVGHHGEFFDFLPNPIPQEALVSLDPEIILPFKLHSFRIDDPSFLPEQAWQITGPFGVWGIAAAEDSLWIAGQISLAGSNDRFVDGLVRFPALD